jgi:hypothetical protein
MEFGLFCFTYGRFNEAVTNQEQPAPQVAVAPVVALEFPGVALATTVLIPMRSSGWLQHFSMGL